MSGIEKGNTGDKDQEGLVSRAVRTAGDKINMASLQGLNRHARRMYQKQLGVHIVGTQKPFVATQKHKKFR